jgi:hypothetical protein
VGAVTVASGGSLVLTGASIRGGIEAASAEAVVVRDSALRGAVNVTGTTGDFVFAGNDLRGSLTCTGNASVPDSEGTPNAITGSSSGQCADL